MVIPLKDYNPTRRPAVFTMVLIAACIAVYFLVQPQGRAGITPSLNTEVEEARFSFEHAAIPCEVITGRPLTRDEIARTLPRPGVASNDQACTTTPRSPPAFPGKSVYLAVVYSMFLHGGLLHIAGNMLFLWVFGNNIEDAMGPLAYLAFYLAAGLAAAIAHVLVQPASTIPIVGASGTIAGVMGAYLVLYPNVVIRSAVMMIVVFFIRDIPAKWLLGFWFVLQFFTAPDSGVAWVAHVGGFVFGAVVGLLLRDRLRPKRTVWGPQVQY